MPEGVTKEQIFSLSRDHLLTSRISDLISDGLVIERNGSMELTRLKSELKKWRPELGKQ